MFLYQFLQLLPCLYDLCPETEDVFKSDDSKLSLG